MTSFHSLCLASCVLLSPATASPQSKPGEPALLWSQDILHQASKYPAVSFISNDRLLLSETETTGQLSLRGSLENTSEFKLHVSMLDARSGRLEFTKDWNTRLHRSQVLATGGGVLIKTGGDLRLYSSDFEQEKYLPIAPDPSGLFFVSSSASGRTIAVSRNQKEMNSYVYSSHIDVLDAGELRIRASWDQYPPVFRISMSDDSFVSKYVDTVTVAKFGNLERHTLVDKHGQECGGVPTILSDDSVILRGCKAVLLFRPDGKSYSLDFFDGRGTVAPRGSKCEPYNSGIIPAIAAVASGESRFVAIALPEVAFKKELLAEGRECLEGLRIAIYDVALQKRISMIDVGSTPKKDFVFALSPDGSSLAILNDLMVSVYGIKMMAIKQ